MRKDVKAKFWIDILGAVLALIGFAGLGGACEGQGSAIVAMITFSVGFSLCLWGYQR